MKRAKVIFTYETERIPYIISSHYTPDFVVELPSGKIYIECKGHFRPEDKRKMVAVKKMHPGKDIRIVFYKKNNKLIKWAEKYGFIYAFEKIPKDWINETH